MIEAVMVIGGENRVALPALFAPDAKTAEPDAPGQRLPHGQPSGLFYRRNVRSHFMRWSVFLF